MFNCPGKVCRHLPGYFFARFIRGGQFPIIVFVPGLLDISTKEKGRAIGEDQWPLWWRLFLLLDFYFVTFFEGGEISPEKWRVRNKWSRGKAPQMIE